MTIRAKSADGTIHQFPDGTPKETIGAAMKRYAEFNTRASTLDERDLSIARSKNDPFGAFLRKKSLQPREGETSEQREERLYGRQKLHLTLTPPIRPNKRSLLYVKRGQNLLKNAL